MPGLQERSFALPQHEETTWNKLHRYFGPNFDGNPCCAEMPLETAQKSWRVYKSVGNDELNNG
jgi:hypothetical protein